MNHGDFKDALFVSLANGIVVGRSFIVALGVVKQIPFRVTMDIFFFYHLCLTCCNSPLKHYKSLARIACFTTLISL